MIVCVSSGKGGTGKTTTAYNLADYLSRHQKKKVILIDADPSCSLMDIVGIYDGHNVLDVFRGDRTFQESSVKIADNLDYVLGCHFLFNLIEISDPVFRNDIIYIFDTAPGINELSLYLWTIANLTIIPVQPHLLSVSAGLYITDVIKNDVVVFLNGITGNEKDIAEIRNTLKPIGLLKNEIRFRPEIFTANDRNKTVEAFAPNSIGALDMFFLFDELQEKHMG